MGEAVGQIVGKVLESLLKARRAGLSRAEAERELAHQAERGELVSDELWASLGNYVDTTRDFERGGA